MNGDRKKLIALGAAGTLVAAAIIRALTGVPQVSWEVVSNPPQNRGFGPPCNLGDQRTVNIYGRLRVWDEGAVLPLRAALKLAMKRSSWRPDKAVYTYACRYIRGGSTWSYHAWPLAMDLDPADNPLGVPARNTELGRHPEVVQAFKRFFFVWGGTWSRPDAMHFQYDGPYVPLRPTVRPGDRGAKVKAVRRLLRLLELPRCMEGPYGCDRELRSVTAFQRKNALLAVDKAGVVGPATWTYLVKAAR